MLERSKTPYTIWSDLLATQCGHSTCALLALPQPEHLFNAVTSFKALPAICLWRFFMCDVFFFGTARRTDSQISETREGMGIVIAGSSAGCHLPSSDVCRTDLDGDVALTPIRDWATAKNERRNPADGAARRAIMNTGSFPYFDACLVIECEDSQLCTMASVPTDLQKIKECQSLKFRSVESPDAGSKQSVHLPL